jgi:histidine kinase/DNA gyrase B/HSP90-like ATPase
MLTSEPLRSRKVSGPAGGGGPWMSEMGTAAALHGRELLPTGSADQMFLPFTQSAADKSGLGLGLAISRRSVEANDGVLRVRDVPGSGCVFTIDLPRHALK